MAKPSKSKLFIIIGVITLAAIFFIFDLGQYLTLDYLKAQRQDFLDYYNQNTLYTIGVYMLIYITVAALSLPGAVVMTLAGGAIFGLTIGTIAVSFASTIGATLAFLAARLLLKDFVQNKFQAKLRAINEGVDKDGAFYLFTLRLIPLFPFFMINLIMGLTSIRTLQFFFVSQLGMLPGTLVYVNAGSQIAAIDSLAGILSPGLILSFILLGLFPFIARKIVNYVKSQKYMKRYTKPTTFDYNLAVIGGGSAGLVSSYIAAAVRAKVILIEKHKMGGDCLNTGCVPSKALIRSAKMLSYAKRATDFGFKKTTVEFDFAEVMARVQRVIKKIEPHDSVERYTKLGVECEQGEAIIRSPYEVEVNGKTITAKNIIIATGARPTVPTISGLDKIKYFTSDTIWDIREQPKKMGILGGGPIGCELAQAFQRLGTDVTLIQRGPRIMPKEDVEISAMVSKRFKAEGMQVLTSHEAIEFGQEQGQDFVICQHGEEKIKVEFDHLLIALGRTANTTGFGLDQLDIQVRKGGTIEADEFLRTNYPNIYVCGDVTGPYQFTHVAAHQAWYAAVNALFNPLKKFRVDYSVIPWATYTDPEVARVGINEQEAKQQGIAYEVTSYGIDDLDRAIADDEDHGVVKVLTVPGKDKILGATIVGSQASDLITEFVTAMKHGFGLNKILGTIHIYPTLAEANKYAAGIWKNNHKPEKVLTWLEKFHTWRRLKNADKPAQNNANSVTE